MEDELERQNVWVEQLQEEISVFYMKEINVDGIRSSWVDDKGYSRLHLQPMVEFKSVLDAGTPMHVKQDFIVDEQAWLKEGRIRQKI